MNSLKKFVIRFFDFVGGIRFLRNSNKTPMVLFWHGVSSSPDPIIEAECISEKTFEKQIRYLIKHYEIISINEFYNRYKSNSFTNREIVLTFDDGYKNNLSIASKVLEKYNLPYTIFVSTSNVDSGARFYASIPRLILVGGEVLNASLTTLKYEYHVRSIEEIVPHALEIENRLKELPLNTVFDVIQEIRSMVNEDQYKRVCSKYNGGEVLNWDELRELSKSTNCTIGSHCCEHICCHSKQDKEIIRQQIINSKFKIENEIGIQCDFFSYPNGDYTSFSNSIVRDTYIMGFSTESHKIISGNENEACVGRVSCPRDIESFKFLIAYKTNRIRKFVRAPKFLIKKISYYNKWFLFRIAQLGCLNPISPRLRPWLWKKIGVNINGKVCIGYDVYFDVGNANLITIEDGVWIASRSLLLCHKRDMTNYRKGDDYNLLPYIKEPIYLKKGCCIGMGSTIMPGVTIGEGSVVGTGSLVTKDVPNWCIVTGRPAKIVKQL